MKAQQKLTRFNVPSHAGPNVGRHLRRKQFAQVVAERDRWRERYHRATPILGVLILVVCGFISGYIVRGAL